MSVPLVKLSHTTFFLIRVNCSTWIVFSDSLFPYGKINVPLDCFCLADSFFLQILLDWFYHTNDQNKTLPLSYDRKQPHVPCVNVWFAYHVCRINGVTPTFVSFHVWLNIRRINSFINEHTYGGKKYQHEKLCLTIDEKQPRVVWIRFSFVNI